MCRVAPKADVVQAVAAPAADGGEGHAAPAAAGALVIGSPGRGDGGLGRLGARRLVGRGFGGGGGDGGGAGAGVVRDHG